MPQQSSTSAALSDKNRGDMGCNHFPKCWTIKQYDEFKAKNNFLLCIDGKIGCSVCNTIKPENYSKGWIACSITPNGETRELQVTSFRKKIYKHKLSEAHRQACKLLELRKGEHLKANFKKSNQADINTTECVFRTAYYIAKNNRPYTDHPELIDLQKLKGVNAGRVLRSNVVCADIIDSISEQMKKKVLHHIQQYPSPFSTLTDERTCSSGVACLIIYLRYTFNHFPINIFVDLLELNATNVS